MDCREFRQNHVAFVDDLLPGIDLIRMQRHLIECGRCSHHDTMVRRALLVVRNVPCIEPSPGFTERLHARIHALGPVHRAARRSAVRPKMGTFAALTTGMVAAGMVTMAAMIWSATSGRDIVLAPVVASIPAPAHDETLSPIPVPAMVASASTGIALWPAVMAAEQAPLHFAAAEFRLANYRAPAIRTPTH